MTASDPGPLLSAILASARVRAASISRTTMIDLERCAAVRRPRAEAFRSALRCEGRVNVIAECKRRSPLKGVLRRDYVAADLATEYEGAGAAAVSVITEPTFFDGGLDDLQAVAAHVDLPLLRKDFIVDERQLVEARAAGADGVLLIARALDDPTLRGLLSATLALAMAALVEVHDQADLDRALAAGAAIVGVNARDLGTMQVASDHAAALVSGIPDGIVRVAESGIHSRADVARLRDAGFDAFLVGEHLVTSERPGEALARLIGPETACS